MPDFDALLSQQRDVLLNPRRTTGDIIRAGIQATTGVPYSEAIGGIEAQKFDRALRGYQILSAEREFAAGQEQRAFERGLSERREGRLERQFGAEEAHRIWQRAQAEAARGDDNAARLLELSAAYGATDADAQRLAAAVIARTETEDIDDASALPGLVAAEAERLGLPARPDLTIMSGPEGAIYSIDPTGTPTEVVAGRQDRKTVTLSPGQRIVDINTGETIATSPAAEGRPITLSPGQSLVDRDGNVITSVPDTPPTVIPRTDEGKISADLDAGLITPAQAMRAQRELYTETDETWRPITEEERTQYGIPEGQAAQISTTGKVQTIGRGGEIYLYDEAGNITAQVGGTPLTSSQVGKQGIEISENLRRINENLSELDNALGELEGVGPRAVGVSGAFISNVGGLIDQAANLFGADGSWLDTPDVQTVRSNLGSLFGRYIPTITAEEGGRYTEGDVARAAVAAPLVESPLASYGQVVTALETLRDIETRAFVRERMRQAGFAPDVDLTYHDGRRRYTEQLMREGMSVEEAVNRVFELVDQYEIPLQVRGVPVQEPTNG